MELTDKVYLSKQLGLSDWEEQEGRNSVLFAIC